MTAPSAQRPLRFGSLFAGIGGIDLGLERAGMSCAWQVEIDDYCRKVLAQHWPNVKRYGDIRTIEGSELEPVDLICGGYPCQPFSQAGKRGGEADPRHLWPEFARLIRVLRPRFVMLENVPGHLSLGFGRVLGDLAGLGYDAEWLCLRASDFGASHLRKRIFVVATLADARYLDGRNSEDGRKEIGRIEYTSGLVADRAQWRQGLDQDRERQPGEGRRHPEQRSDELADPGNGQLQEPRPGSQGRDGTGSASQDVPDTIRKGLEEREGQPSNASVCGALPGMPFAPGPNDPRWAAIIAERPDLAPALVAPIRGVADGISAELEQAMQDRTKRLGRLGNAVVPQCAEWIGSRIMRHLRPGVAS